jgi:hypothetical protein
VVAGAIELAWDVLQATHRLDDVVHYLHHVADNAAFLPSLGTVIDATLRLGFDTIDAGEGNDVVAGDDTIVSAPALKTSVGLVEDVQQLEQLLGHADAELLYIGDQLIAVEHHLRDQVVPVVYKGRTYRYVKFHVDKLIVGEDSILGGGGNDLLVGDDRFQLAPSINLILGGTPVHCVRAPQARRDGAAAVDEPVRGVRLRPGPPRAEPLGQRVRGLVRRRPRRSLPRRPLCDPADQAKLGLELVRLDL